MILVVCEKVIRGHTHIRENKDGVIARRQQPAPPTAAMRRCLPSARDGFEPCGNDGRRRSVSDALATRSLHGALVPKHDTTRTTRNHTDKFDENIPQADSGRAKCKRLEFKRESCK